MCRQYRIEYLPVAQKDLAEIINFIQMDNPGAALDFLNQVDETVSNLKNFPYMGQIPKDNRLQYLRYQMLIVKSHLIFYVVNDDVVEIRRILHGRRKYNFLV